METTAAVLATINQALQIQELVIPPLKAGQVLVEIAYSGICHSQLNEIHGLKGEDRFLPHTLGHEGSGIVLEAGPDVTKVKPGDHVILTWIKGLGRDVPSTQYTQPDGTTVNSGAISTFMTRTVISENRLVPIAKEMPLKEAALLGCAVPTGAGIVKNTAKAEPGQSVAVFGLGGIGLSTVLMAGQLNAGSEDPALIIAVDVIGDKLTLAQAMGATQTIDANSGDVLETVMELTSGKGVDYAIEAAGLRQTMELAFRCVRANGGLCILAGNLPQGETISINPFDLICGKRIVGTWGGETDPDRDIPAYVDSFLAHEMKLTSLIAQSYSLSQINEAIKDMEAGQVGRCLIEMGA